MSSQSIFRAPFNLQVPSFLPLESNAYNKGPSPESLCVQNTFVWHFDTASPLLSVISSDEIRATTSASSNPDAAVSTGTRSEPPKEVIEHEPKSETERHVEMTKQAFLVI